MITRVSHITYFVSFRSEPKEQFYGIEAIVTDGVGNWFSMSQPK
jgi:hypothetical protein